MSAAKSAKHTHDHDHTHHDHDGVPHGTFNDYVIGFALSVFLTVIPFWLVMGRPLEGVFSTNVPTALILMGFAVTQMIVHMVFFLHMKPKSEGGWIFLSLFFTLIVVVITMAGSMWVMFHLNTNMMPSHDMNQMDKTGESFIPSAPSLPSVPMTPETVPASQPVIQPGIKQPAI